MQCYLWVHEKSNAELYEEQDGGKQNFVGQITAKLQAIFELDVVKKMEKK